MVAAYARVAALGGGVACPGAEVALPTVARMRSGPVDALAADLERFEARAGLTGAWPPFAYRTLFMTLPALPGVCLTARGLLDVRAGEVLAPAKRLPSSCQ